MGEGGQPGPRTIDGRVPETPDDWAQVLYHAAKVPFYCGAEGEGPGGRGAQRTSQLQVLEAVGELPAPTRLEVLMRLKGDSPPTTAVLDGWRQALLAQLDMQQRQEEAARADRRAQAAQAQADQHARDAARVQQAMHQLAVVGTGLAAVSTGVGLYGVLPWWGAILAGVLAGGAIGGLALRVGRQETASSAETAG